MKIPAAIFVIVLILTAARAGAWESSLAEPSRDMHGDLLFDGEHLQLTSPALAVTNAFSFLENPPEDPAKACATVRDFNTPAGNMMLLSRQYCPAHFSELPDFSHSMEDYINQNRKCPPYAGWDTQECHSFEHFMGALNSTHFPPQAKTNYTRYHTIAKAVTALAGELHEKLSAAEALSEYRGYYDECRMEALTYESIAQHYLQDQWSMGHMWHRWGGPEVSDFPTSGKMNIFGNIALGEIAYGTVVGGIAGMIHGWKSSAQNVWFLEKLGVDDAMNHYTFGVDWFTGDRSESTPIWPGWGDLYLPELVKPDNPPKQKQVLDACMWQSIWQLNPFEQTPGELDEVCWKNLATNQAMNIGMNKSPSAAAHHLIGFVGRNLNSNQDVKILLKEASRDLVRLSATFRLAAYKDPYDTYLAEGYTSKNRDRRLDFMSVLPNDEYNRAPSYMDPARDAPGDPSDSGGVQPLNPLFGVRQIRYFNKCHTELFCESPWVLNDHRDRCRAAGRGAEVDCLICDDLAARYFIGEPPLCEILAPDADPDPGNQTPPKTAEEISAWCRGTEKEDCPPGESCDDLEAYYGEEDCSEHSSDFVEYRFCLNRNHRCTELKGYDEFGAHMYNGCLLSLEAAIVWDDPDAAEGVCRRMDWPPTKEQCLAHVKEVRELLKKREAKRKLWEDRLRE